MAKKMPLDGKPLVLLVGELPPPVGGQANINARMADALSPLCQLVLADISPGRLNRGARYHLNKLSRVFSSVWKIFRIGSPDTRLYLSAGSGWGLVYNLLSILAARLTGCRIFIHYHSFTFVDQKFKLMSLLVDLAGRGATHIFLCDEMREKFRQQYGNKGTDIVCSNFELLSADVRRLPPVLEAKNPDRFRIGLISHLGRDKGLFEFLALLAAADPALHIQGVLAGPPVSSVDDEAIRNAQRTLKERLDYRGSVAGREKEEFFSDIDAFVFPTRFVVEAQPLVLIEALSYGLPIITFARGCIRSDLEGSGALTIDRESPFGEQALNQIRQWIEVPGLHASARQAALRHSKRAEELARGQLNTLLSAIVK